MVSPKVQHFPTPAVAPAVRRVAHAPIVAKRLRKSSLPPALRGLSGDSPPAVGESRTGAALQRLCGDTFLPARVHAFPGTQHHLRCGVSRTLLSSRNVCGKAASRPRLGVYQGIPPCGACGGRIAHWSCAPGISRRYVPRLPCYFLSGSILPQSQLSASIL